MTTPRRLCVVTGTRAEYGLLFWLMKAIQEDPALALQVVATGTHLDDRFGRTETIISGDGFTIDARVNLKLGVGSKLDTARSMGAAVDGLAQAFAELSPDCVILLGDRYETLGAATAATIMGLPIAHIHGGELTQGAIDDAFRHAITKMAHLHFAAAEPYCQRIIQMGETPEHVHNVGAIGLDNIKRLSLMDRHALSDSIGMDLSGPYFLVTYHPETIGDDEHGAAIDALLDALADFPDHKVLVTGVNADPGHGDITKKLSAYANDNSTRVILKESLGQVRYLSAMKYCDAVVGNSSSGMIEAPAMAVPTVNIGHRQDGRLRASSVIDCTSDQVSITSALQRSTTTDIDADARSLFGDGKISEKIVAELKSVRLEGLLSKAFHDAGEAG